MTFNRRLSNLLNEIKKDCLELKKQKYLTEYGKGQLDLIKIIEIKCTFVFIPCLDNDEYF